MKFQELYAYQKSVELSSIEVGKLINYMILTRKN